MWPRTRCTPRPARAGVPRHAGLPSPAGLTRGSILFVRTFLRIGWIAGSSPAMTTAITAPVAPHPARAFSARHPLPANCGARVETESDARADSTSHDYVLRRAAAFAHPCAGVPEHADHDPARAHQQHAIVRHGVAIILGLRHAGGDLVGHRAQLDPRRQLGPDIGVDGGGRLTLQRLVDRAALIV